MSKQDILGCMTGIAIGVSVLILLGLYVHDRDMDGAQAGTAAKSAFLDAGGAVEAPSLPEGDLYADNYDVFAPIEFQYLSVACGTGEIRISFKTGEAEFINCNPSDASKHLWTGLKPFFNDCRR